MPVFTHERVERIKKNLEAIRANQDTNELSAAAIKARWFPDGNIDAAIMKYEKDLIAQLEIGFYLLTQCD